MTKPLSHGDLAPIARKAINDAIERGAFVSIVGAQVQHSADSIYLPREAIKPVDKIASALEKVAQLLGVSLDIYVVLRDGKALIPLVSRSSHGQTPLDLGETEVKAVISIMRRELEAAAKAMAAGGEIVVHRTLAGAIDGADPGTASATISNDARHKVQRVIGSTVAVLTECADRGITLALPRGAGAAATPLALPPSLRIYGTKPERPEQSIQIVDKVSGYDAKREVILTEGGVAIANVTQHHARDLIGHTIRVRGLSTGKRMSFKVCEAEGCEIVQSDLLNPS